jgi:hypothetical protein
MFATLAMLCVAVINESKANSVGAWIKLGKLQNVVPVIVSYIN